MIRLMPIIKKGIVLAVSFCTTGMLAHSSDAQHEIVLSIPEGVLVNAGLSSIFVAHCALFIALLLTGTIVAGKLFKYLFNLPIIAGQILGGIVLGPSLFDIKHLSIFSEPLKLIDSATGMMYALASSDLFVFFVLLLSALFTVSYLLWVAGHETDVHEIARVGVAATSAGFFGALFPIIGTVGMLLLFFSTEFTLMGAIGLGVVFSATSVSIPVAMLLAQEKMHLRTSKATLGAAIVDDIVAVILLSLFMVWMQAGGFGMQTVWSIGYMAAAIIVLCLIGRWILKPFISFLERTPYAHLVKSVASISMLFYFALAEMIGGLAGITGAYFAGLFHRQADKNHVAEKALIPFVSAVLLPLFLGSIGLQVNVQLLSMYDWSMVCALLFVAIITKFAGTYCAIVIDNAIGKKSDERWTMREGYIFGASMVARGEVGLVVATILRGAGIIAAQGYGICVVAIVLTTIATPVLLSLGVSDNT
jgi:Kef-type K+ transport system membrane component KefB